MGSVGLPAPCLDKRMTETTPENPVSLPSVSSALSETDDVPTPVSTDAAHACDEASTEVPAIPHPIPVDDVTPPHVNCINYYCAYFCDDREIEKDPDIKYYTCAICKDLYVCNDCFHCGAHSGHAAWLR